MSTKDREATTGSKISANLNVVEKVEAGTQMDEHRKLMPFDFALELQNFTEKNILALRQAKEKNEKLAKEFTIKEAKQMIEKTKRNQIEACKLIEKSN